MAQFTVTVNPYQNQPPNQLGINIVYIEDPDVPGFYTIQPADVTTDTDPVYADPEGDAPAVLRVKSIPLAGRGILQYNLTEVVSGDLPLDIPWVSLSAGALRFVPVNYIGQYEEQMDFDIADTGSGQFSGLTTGQLRLNVGLVRNQPATIGDGSADMDYQSTLVFTREMFTTLTTPPYSDPEGDAAEALKILTLPEETGMALNGVPVVVNQVIPFSSIDAGLFTYTNDDVMDTGGDIQSFTFAIRDAGSGEFSE